MNPDTVPTFRFNRIRHTLPSPQPLLRRAPPKMPDKLETAPTEAKAAPPHEARSPFGDRDAVAVDAERFLHQAKGTTSQPIGSSGWLQRAGLNIRRASDTQHLEAIALAYATYVQINASALKTAIIAELETLSGRKRSRITTDLHLIVDRFVSYGGETPTERLAARKLVSRDVRAIRHLDAAKVLSSQVQALAARPGEGLHAWARQAAVTRRAKHGPSDSREVARQVRAEARQRALIHEVTITTRRPDGTRKTRNLFKITSLLSSEIAGLRARLRGLEKQAKPEA